MSQLEFLKIEGTSHQEILKYVFNVTYKLQRSFVIVGLFWQISHFHSFSIKGIVSDSKNIFLWQKLMKIWMKKVISKISFDSNISFTSNAWLGA